jgi:hypothetical protein
LGLIGGRIIRTRCSEGQYIAYYVRGDGRNIYCLEASPAGVLNEKVPIFGNFILQVLDKIVVELDKRIHPVVRFVNNLDSSLESVIWCTNNHYILEGKKMRTCTRGRLSHSSWKINLRYLMSMSGYFYKQV